MEIAGDALAPFQTPESEFIGLAFAIVVLIVAFGSVLAMGLPIAVAGAGVGLGSALTALLSNLLAIPEFAVSIGAMIGLGVGIDYALFIVNRYRDGIHANGSSGSNGTARPMYRAIDTAGRAVIFAGVTVVISLLGMILIGLPFVTGLAVSAALTVAATMAASVTLLPALIGFVRERIEVTRWRGLLAAGLAAVALLGLGLGFRPAAARPAAGAARAARGTRPAAASLDRTEAGAAAVAAHPRLALEPLGAGTSLGRADRGRRGAAGGRRPDSLAAASTSPTRATSPRSRRRGAPTTCWPRASGPASTGR